MRVESVSVDGDAWCNGMSAASGATVGDTAENRAALEEVAGVGLCFTVKDVGYINDCTLFGLP